MDTEAKGWLAGMDSNLCRSRHKIESCLRSQTGRSGESLKGYSMKIQKALKRLAKIEALTSDLTERYSSSSASTREVLQDAKAAVEKARTVVESQSSPGTAKKAPVRHSTPTSEATSESSAGCLCNRVATARTCHPYLCRRPSVRSRSDTPATEIRCAL
jgi:hypothetical protein